MFIDKFIFKTSFEYHTIVYDTNLLKTKILRQISIFEYILKKFKNQTYIIH